MFLDCQDLTEWQDNIKSVVSTGSNGQASDRASVVTGWLTKLKQTTSSQVPSCPLEPGRLEDQAGGGWRLPPEEEGRIVQTSFSFKFGS